jgi:hypothetical protein
MLAALPVAPLALVGHLLVIPRYGARGATAVTLIVAAIGAVLALAAVNHAWGVRPSWSTVARAAAVTALTVLVGSRWQTTGGLAVVELGVMSLLAAGSLVALGGLKRFE